MKLDDKAADAPSKSLQQCVRLEALEVEIVEQILILRRNIYRIYPLLLELHHYVTVDRIW